MAHLKSQEKLVFAFTNLGTRIAMAVSRESTVGDFKRKFEMAHLDCFPEHGKISVCGLKVRKKSCFYYLSESFALKHAFQGANGWFLHIAVCHVQDETGSAEYVESNICICSPGLVKFLIPQKHSFCCSC